MTRIYLRGSAGIADHGRKTVPEMIAQIRKCAEREKAEAERILAASDGDFRVETYIGVYVQRNREVMQEGLPKDSLAVLAHQGKV